MTTPNNLYYYTKYRDSIVVHKDHVHHFYVSSKGHISGLFRYVNDDVRGDDDTTFLSAVDVLDAVYKVIEDTWGHKSATQFRKELPGIYTDKGGTVDDNRRA